MAPPSMAIAVMCGLVFASAMAGVAADRVVLRTRTSRLILPDTSFHPISSILRQPTDEERRTMRDQLHAELRLTSAQTTVVDSIIDARAVDFRVLRDEIRPRVERLVAEVRADVERVLTPEQRARYRRMLGQGDDPGRDSTRVPR
jgi:hypothetical protein